MIITMDGDAYAQLGFSVNLAGDVNGDGYSDVIAGGNMYDNYHGIGDSSCLALPPVLEPLPDWLA